MYNDSNDTNLIDTNDNQNRGDAKEEEHVQDMNDTTITEEQLE